MKRNNPSLVRITFFGLVTWLISTGSVAISSIVPIPNADADLESGEPAIPMDQTFSADDTFVVSLQESSEGALEGESCELTLDHALDESDSGGECSESADVLNSATEPISALNTGGAQPSGPVTVTLSRIALINHMVLFQNVINAEINLRNAANEDQRNARQAILDNQITQRTQNMDQIESTIGLGLALQNGSNLPGNRSSRHFGRNLIIWRHYDVPINRCGQQIRYLGTVILRWTINTPQPQEGSQVTATVVIRQETPAELENPPRP